jgi:hypothetical protein
MNIFVIGPYCSGPSSAAQLVHGCGFYSGELQALPQAASENRVETWDVC